MPETVALAVEPQIALKISAPLNDWTLNEMHRAAIANAASGDYETIRESVTAARLETLSNRLCRDRHRWVYRGTLTSNNKSAGAPNLARYVCEDCTLITSLDSHFGKPDSAPDLPIEADSRVASAILYGATEFGYS